MPRRTDYAYTVRGHYPFPLDMLRKDRSRAATPQDQAVIDRLSKGLEDFLDETQTAEQRRATRREEFEIKLVIPDPTPFEQPVVGRWESFGWKVTGPAEAVESYQGQRVVEEKRLLAAQGLAKLSPEERDAIRWLFGVHEH